MKYIRSFILFLSLVVSLSAWSQSTTSSIEGVVSDTVAPVSDALVTVRNTASGAVYHTFTNSSGRFSISGIAPGGPYEVKVEAIGYRAQSQTGIASPVGGTVSLAITLLPSVISLREVVVSDAVSNIRHSGVGSYFSANDIACVPSVSRSVIDVVRLAPQATATRNSFSMGGGNHRSSAVYVDGAPFGNIYGLGSSLPGNGNPIALDAVAQLSVSLTPFDVRYSGFQGGAVNMVTKQGTNEWHASLYNYYTSSALIGSKVDGNSFPQADALNNLTGFSVGGPLVKDKLFLFLSAEYAVDNVDATAALARTSESQPFSNGSAYHRPTQQKMDIIRQSLMDKYGYDPGDYQQYSFSTPDYKLLARLDWNINTNNVFNIRFVHTHSQESYLPSPSFNPILSGGVLSQGSFYSLNRNSQGLLSPYALPFSSSCYAQGYNFTSLSAELNSQLFDGSGSNIIRATWSYQYEPRSYDDSGFPSVSILEPYDDANGVKQMAFYTAFGTEPFSFRNERLGHSLTLTDEFSYHVGNHSLMAGAQLQYVKASNIFSQGGAGWYIYDSFDNFLADITDGSALPVAFMITHANSNNPSEVLPQQLVSFTPALYLQDEMALSSSFKLTAGLRVEMFNDFRFTDNNNKDFASVAQNNPNTSFASLSTSNLPDNSFNISPRVGFNWDIFNNNTLVMRGGTGLFSSRIPYVWKVSSIGSSNCISYQYIANDKTGNPLVHFANTRDGVLANLYSGTTFTRQDLPAPTNATIIDPSLVMPSSWKSSLSFDIALPLGVKASVEGIYSYNFNEVEVSMLGYNDDGTLSLPGEPTSRTLYVSEGVKNSAGATMQGYLLHNNTSLHGKYFSLSAMMRKSFSFGLNVMVAYTYSYSQNVSDALYDQLSSATANYTVNDLNAPELGYSSFVAPHRVLVSLSYVINEGGKTSTRISLIYEGMNRVIYGGNYISRHSYLISSVSGMGSSQLLYIPTDDDLSHMQFSSSQNKEQYSQFLSTDDYLSSHRGEYSWRNAAIAPWLNHIDLSLSQEFYLTISGKKHTLDVGVDVKNLANLISSKWGVCQQLSSDVLLKYKEGVYTFTAPQWTNYPDPRSTWQLLAHIRYAF